MPSGDTKPIQVHWISLTHTAINMKLSVHSASLLIATLGLPATTAFPFMLFDAAEREGLAVEDLYARLASTE